MGLLRLYLGLYPFKFHAMNHLAVSWILIVSIVSSIIISSIVRFFVCGNVCDPITRVAFVGLYGQPLNVEVCTKGNFEPIVAIGLLLTYIVIVVLEYRQRNTVIAPRAYIQPPLLHQKAPRTAKVGILTESTSVNCHIEDRLQIQPSTGNDPIPSVSGQLQADPLCQQPIQAWELIPQLPGVMQGPDRQAKNYFLSKLILKTGGVTILTFLLLAVLATAVHKLEAIRGVAIFMKLSCLMTNLAWYWVSVDDHIREVTDKKIGNILSFLCCCLDK